MNIALILSGGKGLRIGSEMPKQYIEVNSKPIIGYCLDTIQNNRLIDKIHIVADVKWQDFIKRYCVENGTDKVVGFSKQGENRQLSIVNGLEGIKEYVNDEDLIFIHDAARPMLSDKLITGCINTVLQNDCDGVLPVLPMKDTVYYSGDGKSISKLLDRKSIYAGQAPEVFKFGKYYRANLKLLPYEILDINGSTEPAILDNMNIKMISGDECNFKITTKADLDRFYEIVKRGRV